MLQQIRIQRKNPFANPEKLDNMEVDLKSRQVIETPKKLDPEIKKARERFKNGETNANLKKLGIPWAPGLPEPTNNDVRKMLNYPERDSSDDSDDPNSTTNSADEGNLTQAEKFVKSSNKSLRKRKPKINDDINEVEKPMINEPVEDTGKDESMSLRKSVIMQMVDEEGQIENQPNSDTLENPKRNYYIYVRDIDYDSDDSSEEYLVGDKLIQYTRKVINIDRIQNMYYEFQGHERLNSMGDIDHEHFKFPAQIWYPFQDNEIDIFQKLVNFEVPNCYKWLGRSTLLYELKKVKGPKTKLLLDYENKIEFEKNKLELEQMKKHLKELQEESNVQPIDNDPIDLLNDSDSEKRSRYRDSARYQQALKEKEYSKWTRYMINDHETTHDNYYEVLEIYKEKRENNLSCEKTHFTMTQMDYNKELYDITPWSHNNYKTPLVSIDKSTSQIPNLSKKIPKKKNEEIINKNEVVNLVKTLDNTEETIKNAPKIEHWDMLSVNTMYTWIEKYNPGSIAGAEMIDILEKSFTKPKVFNLKLMINARLKNQSLKQIDFVVI